MTALAKCLIYNYYIKDLSTEKMHTKSAIPDELIYQIVRGNLK